MDYSIVMPVFNREDLTYNCLATLLPTLDGAGVGEVIVVDNGSRPETAQVLAQFPWVRVIRNESNLGFAAACNAGARAARGRMICHLNNDIVAQPQWLVRMIARLTDGVGIVGARLFFPDNTIQHAGVTIYPVRFGSEGIGPHHIYWHWPADTPASSEACDFQIVTGACLLTPRDVFLELGGFDEIFWNGYEDVDYCFRVRERGLRVVYEPNATLYHYESQSGVQRKRRLSHNLKTLGRRWASTIAPDHNRYWARDGLLRRETFEGGHHSLVTTALPPLWLIVHGAAPPDPVAFLASACATRIVPERCIWLAAGPTPPRAQAMSQPALTALVQLLQERADRYLALIDTRTQPVAGWLDELINEVEFGSEVIAASVTDVSPTFFSPCAVDARCTVLNLRNVPLDIGPGTVDGPDGAVADMTWQAVRAGLGVRAFTLAGVRLADPAPDPAFMQRYGKTPAEWCRPDAGRLEAACAIPPVEPTLASIIMLSWNAPQYTRLALDSIRMYTHSPYEVIIIDNGSEEPARAMLREQADVRVIYNSVNRGFAHGCNQGIAAARGTHVVLLNNDVVVTDGWLERLLDIQRRDPLVGVSAPRSNRIVGHQQLENLTYKTIDEMHVYATLRAREFARVSYRTDRAIGFCLCIARRVIEGIGGIDERYGLGNFEDDDFCIRVRAAGFQIAICEDVFIHHFGSASFVANKVDYSTTMQRNWSLFAQRWGLPRTYPAAGYNALPAIARGFVRERDYVALPIDSPPAEVTRNSTSARSYDTAFVALVESDADWSRIGPVVSNYLKTLCAQDSALFAIGVTGATDATTIAGRIARSIDRMQLDGTQVADIDVADVAPSELADWVAAIPAAARLRVAKDARLEALSFLNDRSPSGLLRTIRAAKAALP